MAALSALSYKKKRPRRSPAGGNENSPARAARCLAERGRGMLFIA